ncbi:maleate cis-trans isomerase [Gordonia sp. Z-3]|uniref:Maleate cis-trans isomerase n=1 Tax=Gordonia tangerina TaxID=2911060 RepID=A0ABS9DN87_9ACTN|nr:MULTISPECIES: maleate cis-trans isomerase [Gordonia]MCF3939690.1 maleate cis-trans isomerase [Gordonia tangerina]MED5802692.1 maleate cis-trans isomerase [Gordonia sp. Z-3]
MTTRTPTVALLYPGHAAEDDYPLAETGLDGAIRLPVVITEIESDDHTVEAMRAVGTDTPLREGAQRAMRHEPGALIWACTSGSFLYGWEGAHEQVARVADQVGLPVSSTSLAFAAACRELGVTSVSVAATYPAPVADGFTTFLAGAGISVVSSSAHDVHTATEAGILDGDNLFEMVRAADSAYTEAVLVPDTALHTIGWIADLEREVGKPVLTANQVTTWQATRLVGLQLSVDGLGALFGGTVPESRVASAGVHPPLVE